MKYLVYAAILGLTLWIISEIIELLVGYNSTGYYLTAAFHILGGFGIWGLHLLQSKEKNIISLVGATLISISYFSIVYFPIQVMNSGLSVSEFIEQNPVYKIPLFAYVIGHIIFGIAVLRTKYFPNWTGLILILGAIILLGIYTYEILTVSIPYKLQIVLNINNILFAATMIYMCFFGLKKNNNDR
jgi:hypothetical protein